MHPRYWTQIVTLTLILAGGLLPTTVPAAVRQFYTDWYNGPNNAYQFRIYNFRVSPDAAGFKRHYVIYYPQQPDYYFFYDPKPKEYWGRVNRFSDNFSPFAIVPPKRRNAKLTQLTNQDFVPVRGIPTIPGATDAAKMTLPSVQAVAVNVRLPKLPTDLPPAEDVPQAAFPLAPGGAPQPPPASGTPAPQITIQQAKPIAPPPPRYRLVRDEEVRFIPRVRYLVGRGPGNSTFLVPDVYYERVVVPVWVKVPIDDPAYP